MIRTLRRKFILVNMLLVSLVLLMVFGVFMASSAQRLKDQSLLAMRAALMWGEEGSPLRPEIAFPLDGSRRPSSAARIWASRASRSPLRVPFSVR